MKLKIMKYKIGVACLLASLTIGLYSCLDGDSINLAPGAAGSPLIAMSYVDLDNNGTDLRAGLANFSSASLTFPPTDAVDTVTFWATIQGASKLNKDLNVTLVADNSAIKDNQDNDGLDYLFMDNTQFEFINSKAVIKAGDDVAEFQIKFFPSKIVDPKINYILPVTVTNDGNVPISSNQKYIYFHAIANPLTGSYYWIFRRFNCADTTTCSATSASFSTGSGHAKATFIPSGPTTISVPTGYYTQPNYTITFDNNNGVLTNFKASFSDDVVKNTFNANGISVTQQPAITVSSDYKKIVINYQVANSSGTRNLTDTYISN